MKRTLTSLLLVVVYLALATGCAAPRHEVVHVYHAPTSQQYPTLNSQTEMAWEIEAKEKDSHRESEQIAAMVVELALDIGKEALFLWLREELSNRNSYQPARSPAFEAQVQLVR